MQDKVKAILIGLAGGVAGGLIGVGGGIIMVPSMVKFLRFSQHVAHATSLAAMIPLAIISAIIYNHYGNLDFALAALFAVGGIIGAYLGSTLMPYVKPNILQRILAIVVLATSIKIGCGL